MFELQKVTKIYQDAGQKVEALKDVSLKVNSGDFISIVGPSGAGKSTLIHIMGSLDSPTDGTVLFKGKDLNRFNSKNKSIFRNQQIGFVFQFYHLIPELTVMENIALSPLIRKTRFNTAKIQAMDLIQELQLKDRINFYPAQLSGGEQQRVAIARALVNKPEVLFCDEPTGNLDKASSDNIKNQLLKINRNINTTIILVTHNLDLANNAQKVLNIKDGCLAE